VFHKVLMTRFREENKDTPPSKQPIMASYYFALVHGNGKKKKKSVGVSGK